jgi:NADH-quinone oxidoreductase subunit M
MANSAIPLTSGYIAEFLSLLGSFSFNPILCILASSSIVLVPSYMLKLYHNISYGKYSNY